MQSEILIRPAKELRGRIVLPASKSISNRALVINALAGRRGEFPENVSECDDTQVMMRWLSGDDSLVDVGAAGTAMRFSTALLTVIPGEHVITGSERMKHRPIGVLVDALRQLGADVRYEGEEGFPPLRIVGNADLEGGEVELAGNVSSQFVSALLMIAPVLRRGLTLKLTGEIVSRPYINMTLKMMRDFGAKGGWLKGSRGLHIEPGGYVPTAYRVESDWSAASYWYEMVALSPDADACVELPGLYQRSLQGDQRVSVLFDLLGVRTEFVRRKGQLPMVRLTKSKDVRKHVAYDLVRQPDLAQTFVVTCAMLGTGFHFKGLQSLRIKETDRLTALRTEMAKLGVDVKEIDGRALTANARSEEEEQAFRSRSYADVVFDTYDDHRMAMAFAPATLTVGPLRMRNPEVVSKSYPRFWEDLRSVGFEVEVKS